MSQEEQLEYFASQLWLADYLHGYRSTEDLWTLGVEDSLAVLNRVQLSGKVLDIGPGGGLPGMVLAIVLKNVHFTLVDSSQKSCKFLTQMVASLSLTNVEIVHGRIEDFGKTHREEFDFAISRAVAEIRILAEYAVAPLKVGGHAVFWKGPSWEEEMRSAQNALEKLKLTFKEHHDYLLDDRSRTLVVLRKESSTPPGFPRKAGIPEKRPL